MNHLSLLHEALPEVAWSSQPGFGAYVHIPFCRHRCHYCDFNTYEGEDALHGPYVDALVGHIETWSGRHSVPEATSVFFGGGTPTLLATNELARILRAVRAGIGIRSDAEITVEANPETIDQGKLADLVAAGFTRVSIGVQSLVEGVLRGLGRTHSADRALTAIAQARSAGFTTINADLIYGSPWESDREWLTSLEALIEARPEHISAYALTVEEGTPLATLVATGRAPDVDTDVQAVRYEVAEQLLARAGYGRYEVSNWALPGRECRHNVLYWSAGEYAGFGAGAHGHLEGRRFWSVRRPADFIARAGSGAEVEAGAEVLSPSVGAGEALMLGLRLAGGVDERAWAEKFGADELARRAQTISDLVEEGWLERSAGHLRTRREKTFLGDEIARRLL